MAVRIGVDGRVLNERYHGIGRVAYELCRGMARVPGVELVVFVGEQRSERFDVEALGALPGVRVQRVGMQAVDVRQLWGWWAAARNVDVMFFPYHLGASPVVGKPGVALVHDCIFETDARFAPSRAVGWAYRVMTGLVVRSMTVATVSAASAQEIERFYGRRVHPGRVIHNVVDQQLRGSAEGARRLREEFGLEPGYVLHVGAQRPHKNVGLLVAAVAAVPGARLVLVGSADERFPVETIEGTSVVRLPFVPEELLGSLYAGAALLAYPSLVEGFGLPMLEAMVAGTAVLASDVPVLREVGGSAALYAAPTCAEAWTAAITRLLADDELRAQLGAAGVVHASGFTWDRAAERLVAACRELAGSYPAAAER
jgi:glycosyltransferase involved in cell wall biosynthesis